MLSTPLRQHGFTLLELLVTLAIVAIVAGLALPSLQGLIGGSGMSATSNQLVHSLQSARSEAIKRIAPVGLCPSANPLAATPSCGGGYGDGWIVYVDTDDNGVRSGTDQVIGQSEPLSAMFSVTSENRLNTGVLFNIAGASVSATGVPIGGNLTITNNSTGELRIVRIASSGRVSAHAVQPSAETHAATTTETSP